MLQVLLIPAFSFLTQRSYRKENISFFIRKKPSSFLVANCSTVNTKKILQTPPYLKKKWIKLQNIT